LLKLSTNGVSMCVKWQDDKPIPRSRTNMGKSRILKKKIIQFLFSNFEFRFTIKDSNLAMRSVENTQDTAQK